jgi:glycosyltransferase involved in cell wall biosynthesis
MERSQIGIVIPALNESATIESVVRAAGVYGLPIVVDDGSDDNTSAIARDAGAVVVTHPDNCGYDCALNTGCKKAAELGVELIITMDSDGQHDPALITIFSDMIDAGADVVVGIRNHRARFSEHLFAWYTNHRFGIKDPLCGMKAYRKSVYESLGHFDSYGSIGTELMIHAAKNSYQIRQTPVEIRARQGESRFGQIVSANYKIMNALLLTFLGRKNNG